MKILILNPNQITRWNPGHQQFRDAIGEHHECMYYGPGYSSHNDTGKNNHVPDILKYYYDLMKWKPDLILTYGYRYTAPFTGLNETIIPKAHIICDFTPAIDGWSGTINDYMPMLINHKYDIYFCMSYQVMTWFSNHLPNYKIFYLPFGVDHNIFRPLKIENTWDLFIGWSNHQFIYPLRKPIEDAFNSDHLNDLRILVKRVFGTEYIAVINRSTASLNTSNAFRTMNMKNFEVMACRRVLITETVQEMIDLGYLPFVHYIEYTTVQEAVDGVRTLINHPTIATSIASYGYKKTIDENTNDHRVIEMTRRIYESL